MALNNFARQQANPSNLYYSGCDWTYNTQADSCLYATNVYPSCYNFNDNSCCTSYLSWEYSWFSCLQTAYSNCFDFTYYVSSISDFLPCYTDAPLTAPQSAEATTTGSPVPSLVLESITTGPPTTQAPHSTFASYTGSGNLLQGYCVTPDYVLLDGPTAFWAPVVGCVSDKTDCCPYAVAKTNAGTGTTVTVVSTVTVNVGPGGTTASPYTGFQAYPQPASAGLATLAHCPADYVSISGGCCPSGYKLWNAPLGGQVPCYSSLNTFLVPPAVPVSTDSPLTAPAVASASASAAATGAAATSDFESPDATPTSAIVNIVYAIQYPVQPPSPALSTGAKAGIGAGAGVAGVAIIGLSLLLVLRLRKNKKPKPEGLTTIPPPGGQQNMDQSQSVMSATSPYAYSTRTDLQTDGVHQTVQTPGGFVPQDQNGYFAQAPPLNPGQQQQPLNYYGQPQMIPPMQGQSPVHYPSPPPSSVSPVQGSETYSAYSHGAQPPGMTGYPPAGPPPQGVSANQAAPSNAASMGYSNNYLTSYAMSQPPPSSTGSPPPQLPMAADQHQGYYQGGYPPLQQPQEVAGSQAPAMAAVSAVSPHGYGDYQTQIQTRDVDQGQGGMVQGQEGQQQQVQHHEAQEMGSGQASAAPAEAPREMGT